MVSFFGFLYKFFTLALPPIPTKGCLAYGLWGIEPWFVSLAARACWEKVLIKVLAVIAVRGAVHLMLPSLARLISMASAIL